MIQFRKFVRFTFFRLLVLGAAMMSWNVALAHADYDRAEPAANAVIAEAPAQLRIWFTQDLFRREGMNRIEVYDENGQRVDLDDTAIDDDNRRLMTVSLAPELPEGLYTVRWFSLSSEDGHEGEGEFAFTVNATAAITSSGDVTATEGIPPTDTTVAEAGSEPAEMLPSAVTEEEPTPSTQPSTIPCLAGGAPLILALGAIWSQRWRRQRIS